MRFWDTSALIPLVLPESTTRLLEREYQLDADIAVWWATLVECQSTIERKYRSGELARANLDRARQRLSNLRESWREVQPSEELRDRAVLLLARHPLRAADALQMAAALALAGLAPGALEFVSLDSRLLEAARSERFSIGNWYSPQI